MSWAWRSFAHKQLRVHINRLLNQILALTRKTAMDISEERSGDHKQAHDSREFLIDWIG